MSKKSLTNFNSNSNLDLNIKKLHKNYIDSVKKFYLGQPKPHRTDY